MSISSGIDVLEVSRVERAVKRARFLEFVFTRSEIEYCMGKKDPYKHLTGRFAAKEAVMKALGCGWGNGVTWKDIEVCHGVNAPQIRLHNAALSASHSQHVLISISYASGKAIALAVAENTSKTIS